MTLSLARLGLMGGVESGKLQHIETKTASNTSAFDFTSHGTHKAHLLTLVFLSKKLRLQSSLPSMFP